MMYISAGKWFSVVLLVILCTMLSAGAWGLDDNSLWDSAMAKFEAGDLQGAAALFNQLISQYPNSPKVPGAKLKLAEIERLANPNAGTDESIQALAEVMEQYPASPEAAEALMQQGFVYAKTRQPADTELAIQAFSTFLSAYPNNLSAAKVRNSLGMLYARKGDLDRAEATLDSVRGSAGVTKELAERSALHSGFIKIMKYFASYKKEHLRNAISALGAVTLSSDPVVKGKADLGIAEATLMLGNPLEARELYRKAAAAYASQGYFAGIALYGVAMSSQEAGEREQAVEDYDKLLSKAMGQTLPDKDASWKSACLASLGQSMHGVVLSSGKFELVPGSDLMYLAVFNKANCLYELGRYDEAKSVLAELVASAEGTDLGKRAFQLLERSQNAKGGRQ